MLFFKASDTLTITVGQRWMFQFNNNAKMFCEVTGRGLFRNKDNYCPSIKVLQIVVDGKNVSTYSCWYVGGSSESSSIGTDDYGWKLMEGQEAPQ